MSRQIYKYPLPAPGKVTTFVISAAAVPVHVGYQNGAPMVWVETETDDLRPVEWTFTTIGTGWDIPQGAAHVGTLVDTAGYVWHYYQNHKAPEVGILVPDPTEAAAAYEKVLGVPR